MRLFSRPANRREALRRIKPQGKPVKLSTGRLVYINSHLPNPEVANDRKVILRCGFTDTKELFDGLKDELLERGYHVLTIDDPNQTPGGISVDAKASDYTIEAGADDLDALAELAQRGGTQHGLDFGRSTGQPIDLAGHSRGAAIANRAKVKYPNRFGVVVDLMGATKPGMLTAGLGWGKVPSVMGHPVVWEAIGAAARLSPRLVSAALMTAMGGKPHLESDQKRDLVETTTQGLNRQQRAQMAHGVEDLGYYMQGPGESDIRQIIQAGGAFISIVGSSDPTLGQGPKKSGEGAYSEWLALGELGKPAGPEPVLEVVQGAGHMWGKNTATTVYRLVGDNLDAHGRPPTGAHGSGPRKPAAPAPI